MINTLKCLSGRVAIRRNATLSDPARFLGVAVAQGDWAKLEEKLDDVKVKLRVPITVAQASLDPQHAAAGKIVFAPEDAALFNKEAAKVALGHLDARIASTGEQRDAYLKRRAKGIAGRETLLRYQREFGEARLKQADADLDDLKVQENTAEARQKEFLLLAEQAKQDRVQAESQRKPLPGKIEASKTARRRLAEFQHDYEEPSGARQKRSDELVSQAELEKARLADLAVQREEVDTRRLGFINDKVRHENNARVHSTDRAGIAYIDRKYPAEQQLEARPRALEVLRATYDDAAAALEAQERDKLGVLADRLKTTRLERQAAETAYKEGYGA
jgi:chromosome segregation ATPase